MTRPPGNTDHTGCLSGGHNVVSVTDSNDPRTPLAADDLAELRREFPQFRIWRETLPGRSRYVARSQHADLNPHTVVTDDVAELRAALGGTARTQ